MKTKKVKNNVTEYVLPEYWGSALINDDRSGMEDADIEELEKFLERKKPGYCIGCTEDPSNFQPFNDAGTLAGNVQTFYFRKD